jgi:L-ascorbate metabolism protein UlaG (beta-lactamase superfamily)
MMRARLAVTSLRSGGVTMAVAIGVMNLATYASTLLAAGFGRRHAHLLREPVEDFLRHARRLAPEVEVRVPEVGEPIELPAQPAP